MASNRCECCGAAKKHGETQCPYCGAEYSDAAERLARAEADKRAKEAAARENDDRGDTAHATYYDPNHDYTASASYNNSAKTTGSRRLFLALMAIFLGSFGVQYFMMGKIGKGVLMIILSMTTIPAIIGVVQGISWLMMSDAAFDAKYPSNN